MNSKKVLFLTLNTFSLTGGIEKVCCSLAKALSDLGLLSSLYALYDRNADLDKRYLKKEYFKGFKHSKLSFTASAIAKGIAADTVMLSHINLLIFALLIKKISPSTKIIMLAHGTEIWRELPHWKKKFLQEKVEIWAVSKYTASTLIEMHQISVQSIRIVNNCLDPYFEMPVDFEKPLHLLKRFGLKAIQPIIFTLTRLSSKETYKGYDRVLKAMPSVLKKFPNLHYVLAGKADEIEKQRVLTIVNELNLSSNVTLTGFIKDEELTDFFKLGTVFVMPSTMEGFGIVFIEAAACGAKIIAGNVDGSVDALLDGELGTLINPENVNEIAHAIEESLTGTHQPQLIQKICLENFNYERYLAKIQVLLN